MAIDDDSFDGDFGEDFAENFFFKTPLYDEIKLTEFRTDILFGDTLKFDGYCCACGERRTFVRHSSNKPHGFQFGKQEGHVTFVLKCTRYDHHRSCFFLFIGRETFEKVGQLPSFADVAIDESKAYSQVLDKADIGEFHKAVGLAAHGVGIGSYVYLRRIFERLITKRFAEHKDEKDWIQEDFNKLKMRERIEFLADYLPPFLVKNAKLYSILSLGIHELDEASCLEFFPVLRQSTIWILEQDKKRRDEEAQQKALERAISKFSTPAKATPKNMSLSDLGKLPGPLVEDKK